MKNTTLVQQQALVAAVARPCSGLDRGYQWNLSIATAAIATAMSSLEFAMGITAKRTARHLGVQPT